MARYEPVIGLEIHAELNTQTKMFCDSKNDPDERHPNVNVCPVCLGHPGTLPVANRQAIEHVIRVGLATGGTIAQSTKFDRKNYFYPDLPKGYQLSQYDEPLVSGGSLLGIRIRRIHLEEDAGNLMHDKGGHSLVDFNRAGVPLMELVTEPDIKDAEGAVLFAREFQRIVRYLGASHANMEKGEFRVEVNISLSEGQRAKGEEPMGTKVELKNLNSFRAVERGIAYEIERQKDLLEQGKKVIQETRGWNEKEGKTVSQRWKEEAHDYRYFPDPDLLPFGTGEFEIERIRRELPELPGAKRERFVQEYGLLASRADMLLDDPREADFFEAAASEFKVHVPETTYDLLYNYFTSDLRGLMNERGASFESLRITPEHFAHVVAFAEQKKITSRAAKDVLCLMFETGRNPEDIIREEGLEAVFDQGSLRAVIMGVIEKNPDAVSDYKKGKVPVLQFLVGQAMRELRGKGDPLILKGSFEKILSGME